jgi:tellurite resistance protein
MPDPIALHRPLVPPRETSIVQAIPIVPASLFGVVLGLTGLANAWRAAHAAWGLPGLVAEAIYGVAGLAWLAITALYALKWVVRPDLAHAETEHPVQCCFVGLVGVSTMLVALGALPYSRSAAVALYLAGALFTVGFALWRTGLLWHGRRDPDATTPVLYLPSVAGGFVTGLVAAALGWQEVGQMAFGAGLFAWLAIESVLLHRLYTGAPMPPALRPTLGIQLAPPAVGAATYLAISGGHADLIGHALIGYALFQALLLLRLAPWIAEQPFAASYWAFTFGATALATAAIRVGVAAPGGAVAALSPMLFGATNILLLAITAQSLRLIAQHRLLPPVA